MQQIDLEDAALLETILPALRVRRIRRKLAAGELCFAAIAETRVVAYVLAGFVGTPSTEDANLQLGPREAYLWAGYAVPQFRRQGVVRAVNLSLCRHLRSLGYESVVLLVEKRNQASLGHCYKMGYRLTDEISCLRVMNWRRSGLSPIDLSGETAR